MQIVESPSDLPDDASFDIAVIGAGGAGMAAALFAAIEGRRVLLIEHTGLVGGTTAWAAGSAWVPGTQHGLAVNPGDTLVEAARYLDHAVGTDIPRSLREAFLAHGGPVIAHLEANSAVRFRAYARHPDYLSELPGSSLNGRALEPLPFDGRQLGRLFGLLRPPIPEFTVLGGMMVDRTDIQHLLGLARSFGSLRHAIGLMARHGRDRLRHPRGTRLVMGNALVGRLLYSLSLHSSVTIAINTGVESIERGASGVTGVVLVTGDRRRHIAVTGGVVLATGGFNRQPDLRARLLPGIASDWCALAPGRVSNAHELARDAGAVYREGSPSHAFWAPVSLRQRFDGSTAVFPHFVMDRAKPGVIAVDGMGRRFVNESCSYHQFALAMQAAGVIPAYLVCDAKALRQYGLGMVRPGTGQRGLAPFLADGYLVKGDTIERLAGRLAIDAAGLTGSIAMMAGAAQAGKDSAFHRGETAYQQNIGDAGAGLPNPCLGPLDTPPFYAIRLYPGDIGAATGFMTDADARLLDASGEPIAGLYAVGNDMQSIMGGAYVGPGNTIGPGLVFAYLAARHAGARSEASR